MSLGSSHRDQEIRLRVHGVTVVCRREGTDGSFQRAEQRIRALSGQVDAIGLGGIDRYLTVGQERYVIQDALPLAAAAGTTPVVDGSGIKRVWEPMVVRQLADDGWIRPGQAVLMVSAMDRYFMAEALDHAGLQLVCGDLLFASRINYAIRSLGELQELAHKLMPSLAKLPFQQLYPTGSQQTERPDPRFADYFREADVIAGDFHLIRRYAPPSLAGKVVLTNTTTQEDLTMLLDRGVSVVATTVPRVDGRSFGANVLEAALTAATGVSEEDAGWATVVAAAGLAPSLTTRPPSETERGSS